MGQRPAQRYAYFSSPYFLNQNYSHRLRFANGIFDPVRARSKKSKISSFSVFKPNTPLLQYSVIFRVGIKQTTKDIPIINNLDSHPTGGQN
jgi:hypothetical protein